MDATGLDNEEEVYYTVRDVEGVEYQVADVCLKHSRIFTSCVTFDTSTILFPWSTRDTVLLLHYMKNLTNGRTKCETPLSKKDWDNIYDYDLLESIKEERGFKGLLAFFTGPVNWIDIPELFESTSIYMLSELRGMSMKTIQAYGVNDKQC